MSTENQDAKTTKTKDRSPDYPATSLRQAVENTKKLYEKDRQSWTASEVAVKHLGYSGLSGSSRTTLSAMKKFGLIEYRGGDLRVTELGMAILLPTTPEEAGEALEKCLHSPKIYSELYEEYPGWELPSEETMEARLIRDRKFNPNAIRGFIRDLKESIDYAGAKARRQDQVDSNGSDSVPPVKLESESSAPVLAKTLDRPGTSLGIPGEQWFVYLPDSMDSVGATKMLKWVQKVLVPQLEFLVSDDE